MEDIFWGIKGQIGVQILEGFCVADILRGYLRVYELKRGYRESRSL